MATQTNPGIKKTTADTLQDHENVIADLIGLYKLDVDVFVDELKTFVSSDPFSSVKIDIGSKISLFGAAGTNYFEALQDVPTRPTDLDFAAPVAPGVAPSNFVLSDVVAPNIPNFADVPPVLDFPQTPVVVLPSPPSEPGINAATLPTKPIISLPVAPSLSNVVIPDAPTINIPLFTEVFPEVPDILLQTETFEFQDKEYQNDLLDRIQEVLLSDLDNGAFGITTADEEAVYSRGVDREVRASQARERELENTYAQRGFRAPTGALFEINATNIQETMERISEINREVVINRAELYRRAREFAIQQGISVNDLLIRNHNFQQERALNAARFVAEFAVTILDAQIRRHNLKLQSFNIFAQVYDTQVRALLTQVEIFKAQVEAASLEQEINKSVVDIYEAQISAANSLIGLYGTELEAARTQTDIEKLKLDQFQTQVNAFVAQIQAKSQELDLYQTQVTVEGIKQDSYRSQVQAFNSRVDAAKTEADVQLAVLAADVSRANLQLDSYKTEVAKYEVDIDAEAKRIRALTDTYSVDGEIFRSILGGWEGITRLDIIQNEAFDRYIQAEERLELAQLELRTNEILERTRLKLSATQTGAEIYKDMLSALHTSRNTLITKEDTT